MARAQSLREAYQAADPRPLASGDPFFVDLSDARHSRATVDMRQTIENSSAGDRFSSIIFTGHRGSGKSTELRRLQHELSKTCFTLYLDVNEFLDAADVEYTDLFLLLSQRLLEELESSGVALDANLLKAVEDWFKTVTKETEETVKFSAGVSTQVEAGIRFPFIARLLAKLTADVKAGSSQKVTTRQELDKYFPGLCNVTNLLLTSGAEALKKASKPFQILVLVDNLDRIPPKKSEDLFFLHGTQLQELKCHAVFTVSIDTFYSRQGIGTVFADHYILPNIKLQAGKSDPRPHPAGVEALQRVIEQRLDTATLLDPPALAGEFIARSGGSVRQLIRLLRQAVLNAQSRDMAAIDMAALEDAALNLQQDFERGLAPQDFPLLAKTAISKAIEKTEQTMGLLRNTAVLEYNGKDVWYDVNPLIGPIDAYQAAQRKPARRRPRRRR